MPTVNRLTTRDTSIALFVLLLTGVTAIPPVHRAVLRMHRRTWKWSHGLVVLAPVLALWHEYKAASVGAYTWTTVLWVAANASAIAVFGFFRIIRPLLLNCRHGFKILKHREEPRKSSTGRGYHRIEITGRDLDKLGDPGVQALGYA